MIAGIQQCCQHVIRRARAVMKLGPGVQNWAGDIIAVLRDAHQAVGEARARGSTALGQQDLDDLRERYDTAVTSGLLHNRLRDWHDGNHPGYALAGWLRAYKEQVFLFTRDFAVNWTNNISERGARPRSAASQSRDTGTPSPRSHAGAGSGVTSTPPPPTASPHSTPPAMPSPESPGYRRSPHSPDASAVAGHVCPVSLLGWAAFVRGADRRDWAGDRTPAGCVRSTMRRDGALPVDFPGNRCTEHADAPACEDGPDGGTGCAVQVPCHEASQEECPDDQAPDDPHGVGWPILHWPAPRGWPGTHLVQEDPHGSASILRHTTAATLPSAGRSSRSRSPIVSGTPRAGSGSSTSSLIRRTTRRWARHTLRTKLRPARVTRRTRGSG
jgi:Transposase IS66 family